MKIKDIFQVVHGKKTSVFRSSLAAEAPSHLCFSIISKLHQSIDLEASDSSTAEEFADAVDYLKDREATRGKKNYSLPAPSFQMPITQASLSQILNASLLLTNKKLKLPKKNVTKKTKSRKGGKSNKPGSLHSSPVPPISTTHAPPTCRLQGYTKKKIIGNKRKTTKSSPLVSSKGPSGAPRLTPISIAPAEMMSSDSVEFHVVDESSRSKVDQVL